MISHLHAIFPSDPTFIERELQRVGEEGLVRKMVVNQNAGDMVIDSKDYFGILHDMRRSDKVSSIEVLDKFEDLLKSKPTVTRLTKDDLAEASITEEEGIRDLLNIGFLVLSGMPGVYLISIPNVGSFLKLAFRTRKWVVNMLGKTKWKEMLEKVIHERWDANVKARWREFRGVTFEWVMMEVKGGGWCEPFGTPGGRGWKLTGKKE
ncbi:serine-threonine protein kinase 19 [Lipomyces kononenkoae]|uniref:Serine-threonine protein kinase 19 n=1 Tax=Lipomyces kononenkoae TaxID=34357 RepID=A0ACC3SWL1_LIPKO